MSETENKLNQAIKNDETTSQKVEKFSKFYEEYYSDSEEESLSSTVTLNNEEREFYSEDLNFLSNSVSKKTKNAIMQSNKINQLNPVLKATPNEVKTIHERRKNDHDLDTSVNTSSILVNKLRAKEKESKKNQQEAFNSKVKEVRSFKCPDEPFLTIYRGEGTHTIKDPKTNEDIDQFESRKIYGMSPRDASNSSSIDKAILKHKKEFLVCKQDGDEYGRYYRNECKTFVLATSIAREASYSHKSHNYEIGIPNVKFYEMTKDGSKGAEIPAGTALTKACIVTNDDDFFGIYYDREVTVLTDIDRQYIHKVTNADNQVLYQKPSEINNNNNPQTAANHYSNNNNNLLFATKDYNKSTQDNQTTRSYQ